MQLRVRWAHGESIDKNSCRDEGAEETLSGASLQRFGRMQLLSEDRRRSRNLRTCMWALLLIFSFVATAAAAGNKQESTNRWATSMRISASDLQARQDLERQIQLAAFQQFDHHKTGILYNVSVNSSELGSGSIVQAIRLRVGSFRKYGVKINEFFIPRECLVSPSPQRVLLIYASLQNTTLFPNLPESRLLASPAVAIFAYDSSNLSSPQQPDKLSITTRVSPISVQIQPSASLTANLSCASFADNSTDVNYSAFVQGACNVTHLGAFALVAPGSLIPRVSSPSSPLGVQPPRSRSNAWKIAVGSVIGGFGLLFLVSLLAFGIVKHRTNAKFAMMEHQAEQGETLQSTVVRNSRALAAGSTRTHPTLENDYAV